MKNYSCKHCGESFGEAFAAAKCQCEESRKAFNTQGTPKVPHFIEIDIIEPEGKSVVNIAALLCLCPTDEGCKFIMPCGHILTSESYDNIKSILGFAGGEK